MDRIVSFVRAQKIGILIGALFSVVIIAIAFVAFTSSPKNIDSKPIANADSDQKAVTLAEAIERNDFNLIQRSVGPNVTLVEIYNDDCCAVNSEQADTLTKLVEFLQITSGVEKVELENTDAEKLLKDSEYKFEEFHYFASVDGGSWLGLKTNVENNVEVVILRYPKTITAEATSSEDVAEEEVTSTTSAYLPEPSIEFTGIVQDSVKAGVLYETGIAFLGRNGVPAGTKCTFTLNSVFTNGNSESNSQEITVQDGYTGVELKLYAGVHSYVLECMLNNKPYTKTGTITLVEIPLTACDVKAFDLGEVVTTLEETKAMLIGTWRGCARTPFGNGDFSYGVEITFRADGSYSARNYDLELNNGSLPANRPLHPAFYYGIDDDLPSKIFELINYSQLFGASGSISIAYSATNSTIDDLQSFKVSTDGLRIRFGYMHNGTYGPIVYELDKVFD